MTQRTRNLLSAIIVLAIGGYWFFAAYEYRELSRLYPQVIAGIVVTLATILLVLTLLGHGPKIQIATGDASERHLKSGTMMAVMIVWTALIPVVGLLIASVIGVAAMGTITFRAHVGTRRAIIVAVIAVFAFFVLFRYLLNVPFPTGLL